ncbi:MAG: hypothetical protein ABFR47_03615, partial [Verrucomicrobiota bacterium]
MRRFFLICAALLAGGTAAFGYTNVLEGATNITINSGWGTTNDMTIGGTTSSNALYIVSGGSLTNADAFVGGQTNT